MAYLPGVPNMSPAPVSPTISGPSAKTSIGHVGGIGHIARSVGKPGNTEHLGSIIGRRGAGSTRVGGGDPLMHSMGHYGKNPPPLMGGAQIEGGVDPTSHAGVNMVRGGKGQMRTHVREGGLGPGRMGTPGPSNTDYSMQQNGDVE